MSFKEHGYLSDMDAWRSKVRASHAPWFELNEEVSRVGMTILRDAHPSVSVSQQLLIVLLHARALQSYQASLLLAEQGLISDARTLSRCIWEDMFCIGALCNKPLLYLDKFEIKHQKHRHSVANAFLNKEALRSGLSNDNFKNLQQVAIETKVAKDSWKWETVADDAGVSALYDTHYRNLSSDAAHPTLESLTRHIVADQDGNIIQMCWEPSDKELGDTLAVACAAYLCTAVHTAELFHLSDTEKNTQNLTKRYVELSKTLQ